MWLKDANRLHLPNPMPAAYFQPSRPREKNFCATRVIKLVRTRWPLREPDGDGNRRQNDVMKKLEWVHWNGAKRERREKGDWDVWNVFNLYVLSTS